jgi:predicted DNA-binding transcriptional regulator AlpA
MQGVIPMTILSLKSCADFLGIGTRKLRYFLDKEKVIPYRALDLGGSRHVRWFSSEDLETISEWWKKRQAE